MNSIACKNQLSHLLGDCVKHCIARICDCLSATTNLAAASYGSVSTRSQTALATHSTALPTAESRLKTDYVAPYYPRFRSWTLQRFQLRNLGL